MERHPQSSIPGSIVTTFLPANGKTYSGLFTSQTNEFTDIRQARLGDVADDTPPIW